MDRPPFFAFYPADFAGDIHVESMTTLQVGAYVLLLCKAWQAEPPASLPNDDQVLARLARVDAVVWAEIKLGVLVPFRVGTDGRLHSRRLRLEYDAALKRMKANRDRAKLAADRRWGERGRPCLGHAPSIQQAVLEECPSNAIQSQSQKKKEEEVRPPNPPRTGGEAADPPKSRRGKASADPMPAIPPSLDTPAFAAAWAEWQAERRERRSPVTPRAAKSQLASLAEVGPERAAAVIQESIGRGWIGLFPDRQLRPLAGKPFDRGAAQDQRILSQIAEAMEAP